jgi:hypothetical protein
MCEFLEIKNKFIEQLKNQIKQYEEELSISYHERTEKFMCGKSDRILSKNLKKLRRIMDDVERSNTYTDSYEYYIEPAHCFINIRDFIKPNGTLNKFSKNMKICSS